VRAHHRRVQGKALLRRVRRFSSSSSARVAATSAGVTAGCGAGMSEAGKDPEKTLKR